jgi:DNA modification methylase
MSRSRSTALACVLEGRRFLGGDAMREHADISVERLRLMPGETKWGQLALLATGGE